MATIAEVLRSYKDFLRAKHPVELMLLENREKGSPRGVRAEAVMFAYLQSRRLQPALIEDPTTGTPDYVCNHGGSSFFVEVTSVDDDTADKRSGFNSEKIYETQVQWFDMITKTLSNKVYKKQRQLSHHAAPGVLAILTEHPLGNFFFGPHGALQLLVGETGISVEVSDSPVDPVEATTLKNSAFVDDQAQLIQDSRGISAIILGSVHNDSCRFAGLLNPCPHHEFPINLLPRISFLRFHNWPATDGVFRPEWVMATPQLIAHSHGLVELDPTGQ